MYAREQLEESTALHGEVLELRSDVLVRSQGPAKHTQTTVLWGQGGVTNPSGGPLGRGWEMERANTSRIPHTRFASMKPNVQGREQMVFEARQHGRGSGNIDVVEKSPHVLSGVELFLEGAERRRKCTWPGGSRSQTHQCHQRKGQCSCIGLELEAVGESLSPCTRGQGEPVGAGGFINVAAVLLDKCAGNQTAEEVPDNESTDASGWFAQCNEASKAEG